MDTELKDFISVTDPQPQSSQDDNPRLLNPDHNPESPVSPDSVLSSQSIEELEKKFPAYVRSDVYGTMGCGELPLAEKVLVGVALFTLLPLRVLAATMMLIVYYVICRICTLFSAPNRADEQEDYAHMGGWRRAVIVRSGKFLSRAILFAMGVYWIKDIPHQEQGECRNEAEDSERPGVIISNHVSYLDILYHMSAFFPSFVAKRSVAKLPLVGLISKCMGCVYVQRESKSSDFKGVSGVVNERIREAHEKEDAPLMMLFPEGTTTNGNFLLPFKTGAFLAKAPVRPVILRYPYERFSPAWDSISGVRHVLLLLCQFVNYLEVVRLPVYYPSQEEKDDPKLYAENVRRTMAREGNMALCNIGLPEKRIYHAALTRLPNVVLHHKED